MSGNNQRGNVVTTEIFLQTKNQQDLLNFCYSKSHFVIPGSVYVIAIFFVWFFLIYFEIPRDCIAL